MNNSIIKVFLTGILLLLVETAAAGAVTNYFDDFSSGSTWLNGTAPNITTDSAAWDSATYAGDGNITIGIGGNRNAFLPSTIVSGNTYTVTVDINLTSAGGDFHRMGLLFVENNSLLTTGNPLLAGGEDGVVLRWDGAVQAYHDGVFVGGLVGFSHTETLSMVLTTYTNATPWELEYYVGNTKVAACSYTNGTPSFERVTMTGTAFAGGDLVANIDNFKLTTEQVEVSDENTTTKYFDDFSSGSTWLNGTTPNITTDSATWNTATYAGDGNITIGAGGNRNAFLPSTIVSGNTYTLTVDVSLISAAGSTHRMGLLFVENNSLLTTGNPLLAGGEDGVVLRWDGIAQAFHDGAYIGGQAGFSHAETLSMVLNTYIDATPWELEYYVGNTKIATCSYTNGVPSFERVAMTCTAFAGGDLVASVGSFELTESVPAEVDGYNIWASAYSLIEGPLGDDDSDGVSNLAEYALNGDPKDSLSFGLSSQIEVKNVDGTNWLYYVHPERSAVEMELVYTVETAIDLTSIPSGWTNDNCEAIGVDTNGFGVGVNAVTNRTLVDDTSKFIRLKIQKL